MRQGKQHFYGNVLKIPEGTVDGVTIRHIHKPAGTVLKSGNIRTIVHGQGAKNIEFAQATTWHELSEQDQGVWMTDLPIEQRQTDELVQPMRGHVLVGGLGLGYAVAALSARPRVTAVTVVEKNPAVVTLVAEATLANRVRPIPVTFVTADLFDYLATLKPNAFHHGLFDIWQSDSEHTFHTTVVPLRRLAHGKVKTLACWNEDVMRSQLSISLTTRMHFLSVPDTLRDLVAPTGLNLDGMCEFHNHIYTDWAVPFWRWYRAHRDQCLARPDWAQQVMLTYVQAYGHPGRSNGLSALEAGAAALALT